MLQGEREMASDNVSIGRFNLDGIPPAARGVPQVEVTFDIDADGILKVSARDKGTNKEQHITITGRSGLDDSEIDRLINEAEENSEKDKTKSKIEIISMLDLMRGLLTPIGILHWLFNLEIKFLVWEPWNFKIFIILSKRLLRKKILIFP